LLVIYSKEIGRRLLMILSISLRMIEKYQTYLQLVMEDFFALRLFQERLYSGKHLSGLKIIAFIYNNKMRINKSKRYDRSFLDRLYSFFAVKSNLSWLKHSTRLEWQQLSKIVVKNKAKYQNRIDQII
jgi:hypothetical protein